MTEPNGLNTKTAAQNVLIGTTNSLLADLKAEQLNQSDLLSRMKGAIDNIETDIAFLSGYLQTVIGTFGEAEPGTILALLRQLQACSCAAIGGPPPSPDDPLTCDSPITSIDALLGSEDYPGRSFAQWDEVLPQGLELQTFLTTPTPAGTEIHFTASAPYYVYVQSSGATYQADPEQVATLPTNVWRRFDGPLFAAFSVPTGQSATVYICIDDSVQFVDCVTRGSLPGDADFIDTGGTHHPGTPGYIPLDGIGGLSVNTIVWGSPERSFTTTDEFHILQVDAFGWQIQKISGPRMQVSWIPSDGLTDQHETWTTGGDDHTFTIPDHTLFILIDNAVGDAGDGEEVFVCKICPPTPE